MMMILRPEQKTLWDALMHKAICLRVRSFEQRDRAKSYDEFIRAWRHRLQHALG